MATPTYQQLTTLSSSANGLQPESMEERILSVLAILASGQNPDGTPNSGAVQAPLVLTGPTTASTPLTLQPVVGATAPTFVINYPDGHLSTIAGSGYINVYTDPNQWPGITVQPAGIGWYSTVGTQLWLFYMTGDVLYLRDMVNARMFWTFTPGATSAASLFDVAARLRVESLPAFVAGDHYVVADASGNLHLSSLGPAS